MVVVEHGNWSLDQETCWFFAGDRASDLSILVSEEVKMLQGGSGLVFQHTFGKTFRGEKGKKNSFVVKICEDQAVYQVIVFLVSKEI